MQLIQQKSKFMLAFFIILFYNTIYLGERDMSKETYNNNELTQEEMFDIIIDGIRAYQEYLNKYKFDAEASFASSFEVLDYLLQEWPEFDINTTVIKRPID